jgi:hypothetical protein
VLDAGSLVDAVNLVPPGTKYLPVEIVEPSLGDVWAGVPAGRDWAPRQHGGEDTYVVRQ